MKDRIILLIKAKNLTAAQFAEEIGVQKSSISHIISGRNNASLDFIQKVLIRYPETNMDWLMFGKGPIFKGIENAPNGSNDAPLNAVLPQSSAHVDLFSELNPGKSMNFSKENDLSPEPVPEQNPQNEGSGKETFSPTKEKSESNPGHTISKPESKMVSSEHKNNATKAIVKIVEFYSDNTYREYFPE